MKTGEILEAAQLLRYVENLTMTIARLNEQDARPGCTSYGWGEIEFGPGLSEHAAREVRQIMRADHEANRKTALERLEQLEIESDAAPQSITVN